MNDERVILKFVETDDGHEQSLQSNQAWAKYLTLLGVSLLVAGVLVFTASQVAPVWATSPQKFHAQRRTLQLFNGCHTAVAGERCYREVDWAMRKHIEAHPDWYVGLSKGSSFEEFQEYLHKQVTEDGRPRCPQPCGLKEAKAKTQAKMGFDKVCHTTVGGEPCFNHVKYTMRQLPKNPDWYPGLSPNASLKTVQYYMYLEHNNRGERVCPKPCDFQLQNKTKEACHDANVGEQCFTHVNETMSLIAENPNAHPGLSKSSTFAEVQAAMHEEKEADGTSVCPEPCDLEAGKHCHTAIAGEPCYNDILYAMKQAEFHSEWYRGLSTNSTPEEFQAFLHQGRKDSTGKKCPMPCNKTAVEHEINITKELGNCFTATEGSQCYHDVVWTATKGYNNKKLGHWFKGISPKSRFEDVQDYLHKDPKSKCQNRACPCHTAVPGDTCYERVMWLKHHGIKLHPDIYEGLSENSTFEALQFRLHRARQTHCVLPCAPPAWPVPEAEEAVKAKEASEAFIRVLKT